MKELVAPNFLIIGAQKAGSTWLYRNLQQHPDIFLAAKKELEFFSKNVSDEDFAVYQKENFSAVKHEHAIGEATPSYFWCPGHHQEWDRRINQQHLNTPALVREYLGSEVRLILLLRNPVERALSAYAHHYNKGRIDLEEDFFEAGRRRHQIIHFGFYGSHLERWLKYFTLDQFNIIDYHEIEKCPEDVLADVCRFLDVQPGAATETAARVNEGLKRVMIDGECWLQLAPGKSVKIASRDVIARLTSIYTADLDKLESILGGAFSPRWRTSDRL